MSYIRQKNVTPGDGCDQGESIGLCGIIMVTSVCGLQETELVFFFFFFNVN